MMNAVPEWYFRWAADHVAAFGLRDVDAETVLGWGPVFVRLFSEDELRAATNHLLGSPAPLKWSNEHRPAIIAAVEHLRRRKADAASTASYAAGRCLWCSGCGARVVPSPGHDPDTSPPQLRDRLLSPSEDPRGLRRTMAVSCGCPAGERTRAASEAAGRPILRFVDYERRYPDWQAVAAEREAVLAASRTPPTADDRRRLDRLLAQARQRAK
jgi:hypothetical protein